MPATYGGLEEVFIVMMSCIEQSGGDLQRRGDIAYVVLDGHDPRVMDVVRGNSARSTLAVPLHHISVMTPIFGSYHTLRYQRCPTSSGLSCSVVPCDAADHVCALVVKRTPSLLSVHHAVHAEKLVVEPPHKCFFAAKQTFDWSAPLDSQAVCVDGSRREKCPSYLM